MEIRIKRDSVEIEGYVNSVERKSKPLLSRMGQFVERICKGAFKRSLERDSDVRLMLNHERDIGGTRDGNLELSEDNIGLYARATVTDPEVIASARGGNLVGWSFGFMDRDVAMKTDEDGMPLRNVRDLDLKEVSILDRTKTPAYDGTLVSVRADETKVFIGEDFTDAINIRELEEDVPKQQETPVEEPINYDAAEKLIAEMKDN